MSAKVNNRTKLTKDPNSNPTADIIGAVARQTAGIHAAMLLQKWPILAVLKNRDTITLVCGRASKWPGVHIGCLIAVHRVAIRIQPCTLCSSHSVVTISQETMKFIIHSVQFPRLKESVFTNTLSIVYQIYSYLRQLHAKHKNNNHFSKSTSLIMYSEAFLQGSIFDKTAFCLGEKQGMLHVVNDEYNRVGTFKSMYQFGIGEKKFYMSMNDHAQPNKTLPLQNAWSQALSAMTVECEQFIIPLSVPN